MKLSKAFKSWISVIVFFSLSLMIVAQNTQRPVRLKVLVLDKDNNPVNDVKQEEFQVQEDGKPQNITSFFQDEAPISYGLLIDNSGSLRTLSQSVGRAAQQIIETNKTNDETFVLQFTSSDKIERLTDLTSNKRVLVNAVSQIVTEGGQTALSDALYLSAKYLMEIRKDEKRNYALIVVTDGEDKASRIKSDELIEFLRQHDIQIFFIGLTGALDSSESLIRKNVRETATEYIDKIVEETGGVAFYPTKNKSIQEIAQNITDYIRRQYVLEYLSSNTDTKKTYRKIKAKLDGKIKREKARVITRTGYKI